MLRRRLVASILTALACVSLLAATGCSANKMLLDTDVGEFDSSNAHEVARSVDAPAIFDRPVSQAADLRHDALVDLRSSSESGAELADLLTEQFPGEARSVPYYTAIGTFDGADAWFILEVWGAEGQSLDQTRLWVFDRADSRVLYTGAIN